MGLRKHGLKIGLSLMAALSLMALGASVAQASWLESGTLITGLKTATGEVDLLGVLVVPDLGVELDCVGFTVTEGVILGNNHANGSNVGHVTLLYTECNSYSFSVIHKTGEHQGTALDLLLDAPCELYETTLDRTKLVNEGNILAKGLATVLLEQTALEKTKKLAGTGEPYILVLGSLEDAIEPDVLSRILSRNCLGVPNAIRIKGKVILDLHEGALTNRVKQLVRVAPLSLFPNELKYGGSAAELWGSVWVKLASGNAWGIC